MACHQYITIFIKSLIKKENIMEIISAYSILVYIVVGILAGWVAGLITKGQGFGLIIDMILGIIGAVVGTWLFAQLGFVVAGGMLALFITAVVGAVVLIFIIVRVY